MMKTAALYIRVSSHDQDEISPDTQKKLGLEFAKKNDIFVPPEFIFMESISGRDAKKRKEFQKMIALAKAPEHPIDAIIVWKFSRFARNQEESIVYKSMLRKDNVEVLSVSEPLVDGPFGSLIERIIEWMDEYYSIRLSGEVMRGMNEKALRQGYQILPPLGYDAAGGGKPFVINEEEMKIVDFIFSSYDSGKDSTKIARLCNDRGYKTKRGNRFERRTIDYILRNPFYAGMVLWNGTEFQGSHPIHHTLEEHQSRIRLMDMRKRPAGSRNVSTCKHWLSGLIKCSVCGATMAYGGSAACRTFTCWKYTKGFHNEPSTISVKKMETVFFEALDKILDTGVVNLRYKGPVIDDQEDMILIIQKELAKMELREKRIREAYEAGIDSLEEYKEYKNRLKKQRMELEQELAELENQPEETEAPDIEETLRQIRSVKDMLLDPKVDFEVKGTFVRSIIDEIVFDRATKSIEVYVITARKPA